MKYCAVPTCGNSSYINYRGKSSRCSFHSVNYGTGLCKCEPPLQFFPFPTKKDLEGRERWTKLINRRYLNGESWQPDPAGRSSVCSAHFPDGKPTKQSPDPILNLGYEPPADLIKRPQSTPRKKKKLESDLKSKGRWSVSVPVEPQILLACPRSSSPHQSLTNTSRTMTVIIPETKSKPRPPKRRCIVCQNISENGQSISSNRGRLDLQECLKQYLSLEVEQGWMCINCVRQVKTIVKKVNMFRSSVLAGQCNNVYKVSHVQEENGAAVITETQSDASNKQPTSASGCQCSRLLTSMLSKQNVCEPMEKTRIRVIYPNLTVAAATDSQSETNEGLQDSATSEEENVTEPPRNKKCRTAPNKRKRVVGRKSRQGNTSASVALEMRLTRDQAEKEDEVLSSSGNKVQSTDALLGVIYLGQGSLVNQVTSPESVQSAPITLCTQPSVSDSFAPSTPAQLIATAASDDQTDFIFTKTLNELAKYVARKPIQEHNYAH